MPNSYCSHRAHLPVQDKGSPQWLDSYPSLATSNNGDLTNCLKIFFFRTYILVTFILCVLFHFLKLCWQIWFFPTTNPSLYRDWQAMVLPSFSSFPSLSVPDIVHMTLFSHPITILIISFIVFIKVCHLELKAVLIKGTNSFILSL